MKFTPEEIAKQREFYDSTMTNKDCIRGYYGCYLIALEPGPDDGKPEYYDYATFYDEEDAKYAYYAITTHSAVLEEVERLRVALKLISAVAGNHINSEADKAAIRGIVSDALKDDDSDNIDDYTFGAIWDKNETD